MRKLLTVLGIAAALSVAPIQAEAQSRAILLGPTIAFSDSEAGLGVGATVIFELANLAENLGFMGDFLIFFPDGFSLWEFNANATYDFPLSESTILPFALAGLNLSRWSVDGQDVPGFGEIGGGSTTDVGFNVGGGIAFNAGSFRPRAGFRFVLGDGTRFVGFVTLPFQVAGGS